MDAAIIKRRPTIHLIEREKKRLPWALEEINALGPTVLRTDGKLK